MRAIIVTLLLASAFPSPLRAKDSTNLNEHLAVFKPLIGKTYKGDFVGSTPENPMVDISRWERAMNGQAIRSLHSVNQGAYGGETIIMWDPKAEKLAFWYFTTAGFFTQGNLEIKDNTWTAIEEVTGTQHGITKVRSTATIHPDGSMTTKAEFFKDAQWTPGHEIHYTPVKETPVIFK